MTVHAIAMNTTEVTAMDALVNTEIVTMIMAGIGIDKPLAG
jgi:hypothetical protein